MSGDAAPISVARRMANVARWVAVFPMAVFVALGVLFGVDYFLFWLLPPPADFGVVFQPGYHIISRLGFWDALVDWSVEFKRGTLPQLLAGASFVLAVAWVAPSHKGKTVAIFSALLLLGSGVATIAYAINQKYLVSWGFFCMGIMPSVVVIPFFKSWRTHGFKQAFAMLEK